MTILRFDNKKAYSQCMFMMHSVIVLLNEYE